MSPCQLMFMGIELAPFRHRASGFGQSLDSFQSGATLQGVMDVGPAPSLAGTINLRVNIADVIWAQSYLLFRLLVFIHLCSNPVQMFRDGVGTGMNLRNLEEPSKGVQSMLISVGTSV